MTLDLEYPVVEWRLRGRGYLSDVRKCDALEAVDWLCRERTAHATLMLALEVKLSAGWKSYYGQSVNP